MFGGNVIRLATAIAGAVALLLIGMAGPTLAQGQRNNLWDVISANDNALALAA